MKGLYESRVHKEIETLNPFWETKEEYPLPLETRKTMIVKCIIKDKDIHCVSFLPAYLNAGSEPEVLDSQDKRFEEVVEYMKGITLDQGLGTAFVIEGDEVVIKTGA
ncbi:hypothetical protein ACFL1Z_09125 [Thermodesulfobacteriota bacterium]